MRVGVITAILLVGFSGTGARAETVDQDGERLAAFRGSDVVLVARFPMHAFLRSDGSNVVELPITAAKAAPPSWWEARL